VNPRVQCAGLLERFKGRRATEGGLLLMDESTLRAGDTEMTLRSPGQDSHGQVHSVSLACNVGEIENVTDRRGRIRDKDRP